MNDILAECRWEALANNPFARFVRSLYIDRIIVGVL
jgi:hypothetical protein